MMFYPLPKPQTAEPLSSGGKKICDDCKSIVKEDELTLLDFLNSLSAEQQKAALVHLSVLWAEQQGGKNGIRA